MESKITEEKNDEKKPEGLSADEGRVSLTRMIMRLFDLWKISIEDKSALLGLSTSRSIKRYRNGGFFPKKRELIIRAGKPLSIHKSLRVLFPRNREVLYKWPTTPNAIFGGRSPVDYVKEKGFDGLVAVKQYLNFEKER